MLDSTNLGIHACGPRAHGWLSLLSVRPQVVDHQRDVLGALQTKLEAQHLTLVAVGEQRDAAKVEAATLVRRPGIGQSARPGRGAPMLTPCCLLRRSCAA